MASSRLRGLICVPLLMIACVDDTVPEPVGTGTAETETGETGDPATGDGDGDGDTTGDGDGDMTGDGDGDMTGDGDGDTTGDGDSDTTGDGDGDMTGDGDGDMTGDGDGDMTGDGDGDTTGDGDGDMTGDGDGDMTGDGDGDMTGDGDGDMTGDGDGDMTGDGDGDMTGDGDGDDELCLGPILVDIDAPPNGDGSTWATAFDSLQAAIDAAGVCPHPELWVATGVYAPDPNLPVATLTTPMDIYGGFAGNELALDERDIDQNPTQIGDLGWQARFVVLEGSAIDFDDPTHLDGFILDGSEAGAIEIQGLGIGDNPQLLGVELYNLEITNNSADEGAGLWTLGLIRIAIVNTNFSANQADIRGAAIFNEESYLDIQASSFIANVSDGAAIYQPSFGGLSFFGFTSLTDSLMTDNIGGAMKISRGSATNSEFAFNSAAIGGAIEIFEGGLLLTECSIHDNDAIMGGALHLSTAGFSGGSLWLVECEVVDNTAEYGGAILALGSNNESFVRIFDSELRGNLATAGEGGALLTGAHFLRITGSRFLDNSAERGGAVYASGTVTDMIVLDSRFVANQATNGEGGGLCVDNSIDDQDNWIINTEFVDNAAALDGGGAYGQATYVGVTFANNSAANLGNGHAAPDWFAPMVMRSVTAWPDDIVAPDVTFDHACVPQPMLAFQDQGSVFIDADPFDPADLDLDGLSEFYLQSDSPCVDLGGALDEYPFASLTTQQSQCTDAGLADAGAHYSPLFDAGVCG